MLISNIWIHLPYQDIALNSVQHGRTVATQNPSLSKNVPYLMMSFIFIHVWSLCLSLLF